MRTVLCTEAAVVHSSVDVPGRVGPVQLLCHAAVDLTLVRVAGHIEIVERVKGAGRKEADTTHPDALFKEDTRTSTPSL